MARHSSLNLHAALYGCCEKVRRARLAVLFKRGETPFGLFVILEGKVSLDLGADGSNPLNCAFGPGALVGLPAALTGRNYGMTATVTEDAQLGFLSCGALKALLRERPELCRELLAILGERLNQASQIKKAMLGDAKVPEDEVALA